MKTLRKRVREIERRADDIEYRLTRLEGRVVEQDELIDALREQLHTAEQRATGWAFTARQLAERLGEEIVPPFEEEDGGEGS